MSETSRAGGSPPRAVYAAATHRAAPVDETRPRIREALELFVANARRAPIVDDVKLPSAATRAIRAYTTLRKKARPRIANRKPKDERARCRSSPGAVTSARKPTHARREYPVDSARVPEDGSRTHLAHTCFRASPDAIARGDATDVPPEGDSQRGRRVS